MPNSMVTSVFTCYNRIGRHNVLYVGCVRVTVCLYYLHFSCAGCAHVWLRRQDNKYLTYSIIKRKPIGLYRTKIACLGQKLPHAVLVVILWYYHQKYYPVITGNYRPPISNYR